VRGRLHNLHDRIGRGCSPSPIEEGGGGGREGGREGGRGEEDKIRPVMRPKPATTTTTTYFLVWHAPAGWSHEQK